MFEFAKKGLYVTLGLASATKERIDTFAKEFAKRAKLSEKEGRKLAEYLHSESKKAHKSLKENVDSMVQKAVNRMPLKSRLDRLEARVAALEAAAGITPPPPEVPEVEDDDANEPCAESEADSEEDT